MSDEELRWSLAITALQLLTFEPSLKGLLIGTAHGPVHQAFEAAIKAQFNVTQVPVSVSAERLTGALDISQTLAAGKPVYQRGLLATPEGALLINGAERLETQTTSLLCAYLDNEQAPGTVLIVMDESTDDEPGLAGSALADRLSMMVQLPSLSWAVLQAQVAKDTDAQEFNNTSTDQDTVKRSAVQAATLSDEMLREIVQLAERLGIDSTRAILFASRVARTHAALHGRDCVSMDDAAIAAQLVLAPRAVTLAQDDKSSDEENTDQQQPPDADDSSTPPTDEATNTAPDSQDNQDRQSEIDDMGEQLLEAVCATLPQHVIADLVRGQKNNTQTGRDASATGKGSSGRPTGVRRPRGAIRSQRLNILESLKAAAPKQRLRGNEPGQHQRLQVRLEDFRLTRYKQPTRTTTVFVVDASGSAALHRLAEAKGAVELLLAECYVRRDRVAMISFRGHEARLELPPTRSLVRAKRELAGLPGGGGTPLAAGLDLTSQVVQQLKQAGETPVVVIMTDGKANIARDGEAMRVQAMEDAHAAARQLASMQVKCLFVDTAPRARPQAKALAASLQATYLPLPSASSNALPELIRA